MFDFDHITVVLSNRAHEHLGILHNIDQTSVNITTDMINGNQISFDVYKEMDGEVEPLWDKIVDLKYVFIPELNEGEGDYLSITSNLSDSISEKKSITAMSAGILELSQTLISMEVNTEADILREDYVEPTLFYNPEKPEASLLNRILYKLPQWSIGHVDYQLQFLQRTFSVADTSVWDFLSGDVATQFECLFVIDSIHKTINAYDLLVWCDICKTRQDFYFSNDKDHAMITCQNSSSSPIPMTEYAYGNGTKRDFTLSNTPFVDATHPDTVQVYKNNVLVTSGYTYHTQGGNKVVTFSTAPKKGETISFKYTIMHTTQGLQYYGEDTTILIDKENLTNEIQLSVQSDQIKNTFRLSGGDDLMTATIQSLNPNGSDYITKFNQYDYDDMPHRLVTKLMAYQDLYDSEQPHYQENMENLFDALDKKIYYESGMMPYNEYTNPTLNETITRVRSNVTTVALTTVSTSPDESVKNTVTNAVKNLAKVFMNTEIFKVEAKNVTWTPPASAGGTGTWSGELVITKYKNEVESRSTGVITVTITSDRGTYLNQKVMKNLIKADDNDLTYNVLSQSSDNNYQAFKNAIAQYGLVRLASFRDALQGCLDVLIQERADVVNEFRNSIYVPYQTKLNLVITEMNTRQSTVDFWEKKVEEYEAERDTIQRRLNLRVNLGEEDYKIYCAYRRENTYQNSNFISDGLETNELFKRAEEFIELATKELDKASTPQYTITTTLHNLINYNPDFAHIKDKFKIANWLRVKIDDEIYRLRLMSASICLGNPESLTVEFSNITSYHDVMNDVQSVLSKAQSMATSYDATQKQAGSSYQVSNSVRDFYKTGLLSAMNTLKNNNSEEITIDRYGILGRDYDMDTDAYSGEQVRLTHNMLAFTSDGWNNVSLALGKHTYSKFSSGNNPTIQTQDGYGLSADFVQAGYVNGSQIIGGDIYSSNFASGVRGTHINLNAGTFEVGGNKLVYNGSTLSLRGNITASDISGGTINVGGTNSQDSVGKNGVINVYNENNQPIIKLDKSGLTLDSSVKINFANLTGVPDYQTASQVTQITRNTVTTEYVNALNVKAGSVAAENITGTTISGKTISGGTITGTTINGSTITSYDYPSGSSQWFSKVSLSSGLFEATDYTGDHVVRIDSGKIQLYNDDGDTSEIYQEGHLAGGRTGIRINCSDLFLNCTQSFFAKENSSSILALVRNNTPYTGVVKLDTRKYTNGGDWSARKLVIINGLVCKMEGCEDDCER